MRRVVIVGGGFGGVAAALRLLKRPADDLAVTLISDKPHLEFYSSLYRVVSGHSALEVCIPLSSIFSGQKIKIVIDKVINVDLQAKELRGASGQSYAYDYLVLALGSETAFFNIPGAEQFSFGLKSISEASRLNRHLHRLFAECAAGSPRSGGAGGQRPEDKVCLLHLVVVGAGPTGVELAAELAVYGRELAKHHGLDPASVTVDLIDGAARILPTLPETASARVGERLRQLGVNIHTDRPMLSEELDLLRVRGLLMKTETVIWTAGVKPNSFYREIDGLTFDPRGRVKVNQYLQTESWPDVFISGDGAATLYAGMAQTAILDGQTAAANILRLASQRPLTVYQPQQPVYALPVGPGWAATLIGGLEIYGRLGWWLRRLADLRYFLSILPVGAALKVFQNGKKLAETCPICAPEL